MKIRQALVMSLNEESKKAARLLEYIVPCIECWNCGIELKHHGRDEYDLALDCVKAGWTVTRGGMVKCPQCKHKRIREAIT